MRNMLCVAWVVFHGGYGRRLLGMSDKLMRFRALLYPRIERKSKDSASMESFFY